MRHVLFCVVLGLATPAAPAAEPLGRLFFSPAQRAQLDAARSQRNRTAVAAEPAQPAALPELVTYDGIVRRSDGKSTVWINNRAINDGKTPGGSPVTSRIRPDGSVRLGIAQSDRSVDLKVGQSVEIVSGTIAEPYQRTAPSARPPRPPVAPGTTAETGRAPADAKSAAPRKDTDDNGPGRR